MDARLGPKPRPALAGGRAQNRLEGKQTNARRKRYCLDRRRALFALTGDAGLAGSTLDSGGDTLDHLAVEYARDDVLGADLTR